MFAAYIFTPVAKLLSIIYHAFFLYYVIVLLTHIVYEWKLITAKYDPPRQIDIFEDPPRYPRCLKFINFIGINEDKLKHKNFLV